jgi:hypothetical protein
MLRRLVASAGAVFAAIVIPASAASADTEFTYSPDEYSVVVSSATVTVGVPFTVTATGPAGNASFTLEIPGIPDGAIEVAGVQTATTVDGAASFSVTIPEAGTYTLSVSDAEGQVVGTGTVTAVLPSDGDDGVADDGDGLVATGATSMPYLVAAGVLLALGLAALLVARLRGRSHRKATADTSV